MIRSIIRAIAGFPVQELFKLLAQHLHLTQTALDQLRVLISKVGSEVQELDMVLTSIKKLEAEGDDVIRRVWLEVLRYVSPAPLLYILTLLVDKLDDMLDHVMIAGYELCRYAQLQCRNENLWSSLSKSLDEMICLAKKALDVITRVLAECKIEQTENTFAEVSKIEHDVDLIKNSLLNLLVKSENSISCAEMILLRNIILSIDAVSDLAQDIATLLLAMRVVLSS